MAGFQMESLIMAAGTRLACGRRKGAVVWPGALSSLDNPACAGIHDDFVTPRSFADRLTWKHETIKC